MRLRGRMWMLMIEFRCVDQTRIPIRKVNYEAF